MEVPLVSGKSSSISMLFAGDLGLTKINTHPQQQILAAVKQAFFIAALESHWGFSSISAPNEWLRLCCLCLQD